MVYNEIVELKCGKNNIFNKSFILFAEKQRNLSVYL
jgi:hypothetical protein